MPIKIRAAITADYAAMSALLFEGDVYHSNALPHLFRPVSGPARPREYIIRLIENLDAVVLLAEEEGDMVGLLMAEVRETPDIAILVPRRYAVIEDIIVHEGRRGEGIGKALMQRAHAWARARGATAVELNVYEFNESARAFYETLGYTTESRKMRRSLE